MWVMKWSPEACRGAAQYVRRALHQPVGNDIDVAAPPVLEIGAANEPVEGAHRRAAVDLVVDALVQVAVERDADRVCEVPPEHQRHPMLGIALGALDLARTPAARVVLARVLPDVVE